MRRSRGSPARRWREVGGAAGLMVLLVIGAGVLWGAVVVVTAWALTRPPRRGEGWAVARGLATDPGAWAQQSGEGEVRWEKWTARLRGGRCEIEVWDVAGRRADGPVVVFTPGWGESRVSSMVRMGAWVRGASRVVMWDPPGLGDSPRGLMCGLGTRETGDLVDLVETVVGGRAAWAAAPVVLHGYSMGAGVSLAAAEVLAARGVAVAMVIAEAPYCLPATPAAAVMRLRGLPWRWTVGPALGLAGWMLGAGRGWRRAGGPFDRRERARGAATGGCAVVVIHGSEDAVCPVEDGREIAAAGSGRVVELAGVGHTDVWPAAEAEVARALAEAAGRRAAGAT